MTVACANIFMHMAKGEINILNKSALKPLVWKGFIDDIWELKQTTFLSQMGSLKSADSVFNVSSNCHIYIVNYNPSNIFTCARLV